MDKKNLIPQQAQPIERVTTGQLPNLVAELSEEALWQSSLDDSSSASVLPTVMCICECAGGWCSYDGDDAE